MPTRRYGIRRLLDASDEEIYTELRQDDFVVPAGELTIRLAPRR